MNAESALDVFQSWNLVTMKLLSLLSYVVYPCWMNEVHSLMGKNNRLFCLYEGGVHFVADLFLLLMALFCFLSNWTERRAKEEAFNHVDDPFAEEVLAFAFLDSKTLL
jgi:hypothetical protein